MTKKILIVLGSMAVVVAGIAAVSAFEAWVVNVTATIENALYVHSDIEFPTVFPQEKLYDQFFVSTSESFSQSNQTRVQKIDYQIVQKPKVKGDPYATTYPIGYPNGIIAHEYCLLGPNPQTRPDYYTWCYPDLCPYLSKWPNDITPEPGDVGIPAYHQPGAIATGHLDKTTLPKDLNDTWLVDLDVPCFEGQCAQDWTHFGFEPDPSLDGQTFGCDLWVEVTNIY